MIIIERIAKKISETYFFYIKNNGLEKFLIAFILLGVSMSMKIFINSYNFYTDLYLNKKSIIKIFNDDDFQDELKNNFRKYRYIDPYRVTEEISNRVENWNSSIAYESGDDGYYYPEGREATLADNLKVWSFFLPYLLVAIVLVFLVDRKEKQEDQNKINYRHKDMEIDKFAEVMAIFILFIIYVYLLFTIYSIFIQSESTFLRDEIKYRLGVQIIYESIIHESIYGGY